MLCHNYSVIAKSTFFDSTKMVVNQISVNFDHIYLGMADKGGLLFRPIFYRVPFNQISVKSVECWRCELKIQQQSGLTVTKTLNIINLTLVDKQRNYCPSQGKYIFGGWQRRPSVYLPISPTADTSPAPRKHHRVKPPVNI